MFKLIICLSISSLFLFAGCSEDSGADSNNENQDSKCELACSKIASCVAVDENSCQESCSTLATSTIECIEKSSSCEEIDQCGSEDNNQNPDDMGSSDDMDVNPDPCSKCDKDNLEACVRDGEDYSCKKTVQSCNGKLYPDVCSCLYDNIGPSSEGRALCADGVSTCGYQGGSPLEVSCK